MKKPVSFRFDPVVMPHMEEIARNTNRSVAREVEDALDLGYEIFLSVSKSDEKRMKYAVERYTKAMRIRMDNAKEEAAPE